MRFYHSFTPKGGSARERVEDEGKGEKRSREFHGEGCASTGTSVAAEG